MGSEQKSMEKEIVCTNLDGEENCSSKKYLLRLICSVVLISTVQQSDPDNFVSLCIHVPYL